MMLRHAKRYAPFAFGAALLSVACGASAPPRELVDARAAYKRAEAGPPAKFVPAELHGAKTSLDQAEASFRDDGDSDRTKDLAYVAQRKAEQAESLANDAANNQQREQAGNDAQQLRIANAQRTQSELAQTKESLGREKIARADAERRAKEAMDNLARIAAIKEEPRGTVITLSGGVLFASGKWELLPLAQEKLTQVAQALKEQEGATITVEGHTDSQGPASVNQELSQNRARAVREFLVARGLPAERVSAAGYGPDRPISDNKSPEGRANNRRVEIVVQPKK
ncbi:MAG: OmpA family protein [Polyangiaceae bacterium]|jgi:outer membrane protein OmpA-like peptidoglycan-associated protein|nr:OmpA family protein [Polyangiaceae bacterium]